MLLRRFNIVVIGAFALGVLVSYSERTTQSTELLQDFAALKHSQYTNLSNRLEMDISKEALEFFSIAEEGGDWMSVSNAFKKCLEAPGQPQRRLPVWAPIHETYGAYEEWEEWKHDVTLLKMFHDSILDSMPDGSIYFGGTDPGRFLITTVRDVRKKPDIIVLTQNALADSTYSTYLFHTYGDRVWMPDQKECNGAFKTFVKGVTDGTYSKRGVLIEEGKIKVNGVEAVMKINGILTRMIFDHNKANHAFYVEESYVIKWMYPYLEPHGLIFRLHNEPLDELPEEIEKKDRRFWDDYTAKLFSVPTFEENTEARKSFSKLRVTNAGLYVSRKLFKEAEYGFKQALQLYPESPEAHFRLALMYEQKGDVDLAIRTLEKFLEISPGYEKAEVKLKKLRQRVI